MVDSEVPSGSCLELHHGGTTKLTCVFHFTCARHSSKLFVCVPLISSSQDPYEVVLSILPMSQWENWTIVKVLSDRQTLVQEQKCWAVFHSSFFLFFNSLPFFHPEACFALLFCFESPCPAPYEAWEALAGFSRECFSCYDRCSSLPCKPFDFPVRQFSLWNKWTQRVSKQH